jgi:hypothetical protein
LFKKSRDYKLVFSSQQHFCFDECGNLYYELLRGASVLDFPDALQSMTWLVRKAEQEGKLKAFFDFIIVEGITGKVKWNKGKIIYYNKLEALLYHLIKFKVSCKKQTVLNPMPDNFHFTPTRIIVKKQN